MGKAVIYKWIGEGDTQNKKAVSAASYNEWAQSKARI